MAPIFASADIAVLVANFPPPIPTKTQSSLLCSQSGNNLLNSQKVLSRFRRLVESRDAGDTIKLRDLPATLNVRDIDWILNCYDDASIRLTLDKQSIVTLPRFNDIMRSLQRESAGFVSLSAFTAKNDISLDSVNAQDLHHYGLCRIPESSLLESSFVTSTEFAEAVRQNIRTMIGDDGLEEIQLNQRFPDVPIEILRSLINDVKAHTEDIRGEFEARGNGIVYVPFAFTAALEERQRTLYDSEVQKRLQELERQGYVHFSPDKIGRESDQLLGDVCSKYKSEHTDTASGLCVLQVNDGTKALLLQSRLDAVMEDSQRVLEQLIRAGGYDGARPTLEKLLSNSGIKLENESLTNLLSRSQYSSTLDTMVASKLNEIDHEKQERFERLFQDTVMAPLQLYAAAIFGDATLKEHQDAFLASYFRQQIIPGFVTTVRGERLLPKASDETRVRDLSELGELCKEPSDPTETRSRSFKDVQLAVNKFARRQKVATPSVEQISRVHHNALRQKGKAIAKMQRPSDVLQNLLWIALSQAVGESDGLFLSSGKDTSRMIEQYRCLGESDVWRKLVGWRDGIKSGSVGLDDIQDMKELAVEILREMGLLVAAEGEDAVSQ